MKIECLREKIAEAVYKAEKITGKNVTLPTLKCLQLDIKKNNLIIKATNLDLGVEITIPIRSAEEITICVPAATLSSFLQNINDKNVSLEFKDNNLIISTPNIATTIKTVPADDFPTIPHIDNHKTFKISTEQFTGGLRSVWYSSSTSSMKPELSSVYIHGEEDNLFFVATDSFRLAEKKIKAKNAKECGSLLIPFRNVMEIIKLLDGQEGDLEIQADKNQMAITHDNMYITSRIIDGVFPDYKQIIPKEFKSEAVALKQDLIGAFKLANIFSDSFNQVNIKVIPSKKLFEIKTRNNEVGELINKVAGALSGDDLEINFNYRYIIDSFQSVGVDSVSMSFTGLNKPMVIQGVNDRSFLYLVMPMNR